MSEYKRIREQEVITPNSVTNWTYVSRNTPQKSVSWPNPTDFSKNKTSNLSVNNSF